MSSIRAGDIVALKHTLDYKKYSGWVKYKDMQGLVISQVLPELVFKGKVWTCWTVMLDNEQLIDIPRSILRIVSRRRKEL